MKNSIITFVALAIVFAIPQYALAWNNTPCFDYCGGNYSGYNGNYGSNNYRYPYPPAPTYRTVPSVQVVYPNGYYQNYFVPTVRYFPATTPTPVYTTYYPTPAPSYTYPGGGYYYGGGGYRY